MTNNWNKQGNKTKQKKLTRKERWMTSLDEKTNKQTLQWICIQNCILLKNLHVLRQPLSVVNSSTPPSHSINLSSLETTHIWNTAIVKHWYDTIRRLLISGNVVLVNVGLKNKSNIWHEFPEVYFTLQWNTRANLSQVFVLILAVLKLTNGNTSGFYREE